MMRTLLVDHEPMVLRVMRLALEKDGYQVDAAVDGQDALAKIAASCPDEPAPSSPRVPTLPVPSVAS